MERDIELQTDVQHGPNEQPQQQEDVPLPTRRRGRSRSRRRHRTGMVRYEKALLHFGAAHMLLGIVCILLQMVQFTNHSILSETQPGLWCGSIFAITGSVCIALSRTKGVYSVIAMLCFSIVSLFMGLTLASLSWYGAEVASSCEYYWEHYCEDDGSGSDGVSTAPNATVSWAFHGATSGYTTEAPEATTKPPSYGVSCADIEHGYCGFDIGLGRTMHSLLMLCGVVGATISFVLATLACSRPNGDEARAHYPSIYTVHNGPDVTAGVRPITAWEFPPPSKEPLPGDTFDPQEPPPPYEEHVSDENTTRL